MATAIELLHTATLVHDDLIDGALLRRGMPTLNSRWAPGATVLTGDFIFARAAKLAAETNSVAVMKLFSRTLTIIVDGEIAQLLGSRCKADRESYYQRIYAKTASLFETSAQTAALIAGRPVTKIIEAMRHYRVRNRHGLPDHRRYPRFHRRPGHHWQTGGQRSAPGDCYPAGAAFMSTHIPTTRFARSLREGTCLERRTGRPADRCDPQKRRIQRSHQEAIEHVERGLESLHRLPDTSERYALEELANYIVERKFCGTG